MKGRTFCIGAATLFLAAACATAVAANAQVTARQGDPSQGVQDFKSPMILELPLKDVRYLPPGAVRNFKEVEKYYCDDLTIRDLMIVKKEKTQEKSPVRIEIRGSVFVRPSYDRLATLRFDAVGGEEEFATTQAANIKAPEGKTRAFRAEMVLKAAELERLFAEGAPPALLRVTVTVQSDK